MLTITPRMVSSLALALYSTKNGLLKEARLAVNKTDGTVYVWFI